MATKKESDAAKILQQKLSAIAKAKEIELKAWQLANPEKFKLQQEAEALKRQKEAVQFANLMRAGVKGTRKDSEKIQIEQSLNNTPTTQTWNSWVINSKQSAIKSLEKTNTLPKGYQPKKWYSWVINAKQSAIKSLEKTNTPPKGYQPKKWYGSMYCYKCEYSWSSKRTTPPGKCAKCGSQHIVALMR